MSRRSMVVDSRALIVALDDPVPVAERWSAIAVGRTIDEETGASAATTIRGRTDLLDVSVRSSGDGTFCLVGRPWLACPPLLAPAYAATVTFDAARYQPVELTVTVSSHQRHVVAPAPAIGSPLLALDDVANLVAGQLLAIGPPAGEERARILHLGPGPQQITLDGGLGLAHAIGDVVVADAWDPVDLGEVPLRRPPVVIRGRTVRRDAATNTVTPVPNASVTLLDFWTTLEAVRAALPGAMTDPNPAARAFMVAVSPGLVAARDVGPGEVRRQDLAPVAADARSLVKAVAAGERSLRVSDRQGIAAGTVLRIEPDDPAATECVTVTVVAGFGPPDQPGDVTLSLPLRLPHREGTGVVRTTPQPASPPVLLRRDARPGDRTLFLSDLAPLPNDVDVRLSGGAAAVERQHIRRIEAVSDADGFFELPPLHRVAKLQLQFAAPPLSPVDVEFHPEYGPAENRLDVLFE